MYLSVCKRVDFVFFIVLRKKINVHTDKLPTFSELVTYYGPYLALVLVLIIAFLIMQFVWFKRVIKAKDDEIKRLVAHEKELNKRLMTIIDDRIKLATNASSKSSSVSESERK